MTTNSLPAELWHIVADLLPCAFNDKADIVSLSCTSPRFRAILLPYVFKDIRVRFCSTAEHYREARAWDEVEVRGQYRGAPRTQPPTLPNLLAFLQRHPSTASSVWTLTIEPVVTTSRLGRSPCIRVLPDLLYSIVSSSANLRDLRLRGVTLNGTSKDISRMLHTHKWNHLSVQKLWLSHIQNGSDAQPTESLNPLLLFQTIEELRISQFRYPLREELAGFQFPQTVAIQTIVIEDSAPVTQILKALSAAPSSVRRSLTSLDVGDVYRYFWHGSEILALRQLLSEIGHQIEHLGFGLWSCVVPLFPQRASASSPPRALLTHARRAFAPDLRDELFLPCPHLRSLRLHVHLVNAPAAETDVVGLLTATLAGVRTTPGCAARLAALRLSFLPVNLGFHLASATDSLAAVRRSHPHRFRAVEDELLALRPGVQVAIDVAETQDGKASAQAIMEEYLAPLFPRIWGKVGR